MGRPNRPVVAIKPTNFEKRVYKTVYDCATDLGTTGANVLQALNRNGICCGWKLYDCAETLRARIQKLEEQLKEVEN